MLSLDIGFDTSLLMWCKMIQFLSVSLLLLMLQNIIEMVVVPAPDTGGGQPSRQRVTP